mmetsp:Transcript_14408/g.25856  ORF Transcript_14408/g.25856 Transcript_14408/m.25856 type:complete len:240 (+) Transcript_14408:308-1027(+)
MGLWHLALQGHPFAGCRPASGPRRVLGGSFMALIVDGLHAKVLRKLVRDETSAHHDQGHAIAGASRGPSEVQAFHAVLILRRRPCHGQLQQAAREAEGCPVVEVVQLLPLLRVADHFVHQVGLQIAAPGLPKAPEDDSSTGSCELLVGTRLAHVKAILLHLLHVRHWEEDHHAVLALGRCARVCLGGRVHVEVRGLGDSLGSAHGLPGLPLAVRSSHEDRVLQQTGHLDVEREQEGDDA